MMKAAIKSWLEKLPHIRNIVRERDEFKTDYAPGHYHSPIVNAKELLSRKASLFSRTCKEVEGIDLHETDQLALVESFLADYANLPFTDAASEDLRYYFDNGFYCQSDGTFLHLMIRHFKPKRIVEVGSGFSSAVMMDTNERYFDNSIQLTFIEPYPDRLFSLFRDGDKERNNIIAAKVQEVDVAVFQTLGPDDILFIDSTHVSKAGSDVNTLLFKILPLLKPGVLIHFHDIFFPFEYPEDWVLGWKGFGWNEDYILRSFLMYNPHYKIVLFNTFLEQFHRSWFEKNMPVCLKNEGGSLWLRKQ